MKQGMFVGPYHESVKPSSKCSTSLFSDPVPAKEHSNCQFNNSGLCYCRGIDLGRRRLFWLLEMKIPSV